MTAKEYNAQRNVAYAATRAEGRCVSCHKRSIKKALCANCSKKRETVRAARRAKGICIQCATRPSVNGALCVTCLGKAVITATKRAARNTEKGVCRQCGTRPTATPGSVLCAVHQKRMRAYQVVFHKRIKLDAFNAYGGAVCRCCNEGRIEFLSIDHINGGGNKHRKAISNTDTGNGVNIYQWLRNNNYPKGFRVLCMNCNFARGHAGYCPHERERRKKARTE